MDIINAWKSRDKARAYQLMFGRETKEGHDFAVLLILLILCSVAVVMLDSVVKEDWPRLHIFLMVVEWFFTLLFTAEYSLRLWCSPRPALYARSFFGIVDLLAIIPSYLSIFMGGMHGLLMIRMLRLLRIFRILRMSAYWDEGNTLLRSLYASRRKIIVFLMTVFVAATIFGTLVYMVEGPEHGFTSIPRGIYWAVITITTVGYGDLAPQTAIGQAIATLVMLVGYSIIAVPTSIFTSEVLMQLKNERDQRCCAQCHLKGHEADAKHCRHCGETL
jgi:voltage-gated potassium channel